jgi:ABC-type lipoprotein export system ATPase subunit
MRHLAPGDKRRRHSVRQAEQLPQPVQDQLLELRRRRTGVKQSIGYMSQKFSLYEQLTVDQNIRFFGGIDTGSPAGLDRGRT